MRSIILISLYLLFLYIVPETAHAVRTDIERFQLLRDKNRVDRMLKPFEHDFILDIEGAVTDGIVDVVKDGADAAENASNQTNAQQLTTINAFLNTHNNIEHFADARVTLGIPIWTPFNAFGMKWALDVRGSFELGASYSITTTVQSIPGLSIPTSGAPYLQLYATQDIKYGMNFGFEKGENWFSNVYLYNLQRWDRHDVIIAQNIIDSDKLIDLDVPKNQQSVLTTDLLLGYKTGAFKNYLEVQELKISTVSDRIATVGDLKYGVKPLFHYHAQYTFDLWMMDLTLFGGIMKRETYDFIDGFYKGVLMKFPYVPISGVIALDNEYLTLQPRLNLWLLTLDASYKRPLNETKDGFKPATMYLVNLRISI